MENKEGGDGENLFDMDTELLIDGERALFYQTLLEQIENILKDSNLENEELCKKMIEVLTKKIFKMPEWMKDQESLKIGEIWMALNKKDRGALEFISEKLKEHKMNLSPLDTEQLELQAEVYKKVPFEVIGVLNDNSYPNDPIGLN